ncbi:MAG TPA: hypothetical protein VHW04_10090 [Solirubrobacteraceae bacterium]|jgi:hypothetical protein|nr:hypothetical protein [Solirubrobacteraceae bacterium]
MTHLRLLAVSILATALLALPGSALAARAQVASARNVSAHLTSTGKGPKKRFRLKILVDGTTAYDQIVTSRACPSECGTIGLGLSDEPLRAVALQHFGVPDVILGLYTGGAHCCYVDQVYRLDPSTNRFIKTEHDFLDAGARIVDLNGDHNYEFLSADARISNAGFTDFADSPPPLQIFSFSHSAFHDITRTYPNRLRADAARWLRAFHHHYGNGRGLIAAWAADEQLLGRPGLVKSQLAGALKAGHLRVPASFGGPSPAKFVTQLQALLRRLGYTR